MRRVLAELFAQHRKRHLVQGYGVSLAVLALAGRNPGMATLKVRVWPLQGLDVSLAHTSRYLERRHIGQVLGLLHQEPLELGLRQRAHRPTPEAPLAGRRA